MNNAVFQICKYAIPVLIIFFSAAWAGAKPPEFREGFRLYQQGDYYRAIFALERVIERYPQHSDAHLLLASSYLETGDALTAGQKAERAVELFPAIPAHRWIYAEALLQQKMFRRALDEYKKLKDEISRSKSLEPLEITDEQVDQRIGLVYRALSARSFHENKKNKAVSQMRQAVEHLKDSVQVHKALIFLLTESEAYEEAIQAVDYARNFFPDDTELLQMKAGIYYRMDDRKALLDQYEELYQNAPEDVTNGLIYAGLLHAHQRSAEALTVLEDLLKRHPEKRQIYHMLADIYERQFHTEARIAVLRKMEKQFPDEPEISRDIALAYESEEMWQHARAVYDSLALETGDELKYRLAIAHTYAAQDSLEAAYDIYQKLTQHFPDNDEVHFKKGRNLETRRKWEAAYAVYRNLLLTAGVVHPEYYLRLGVAAKKTGKQSEALEYLQKAVNRGADDPEANLYLSRLFLEKGDPEEAALQAERALYRTLAAMAEHRQALDTRIQQEGLQAYTSGEADFRELDKLDRLAEESFLWFTGNFSESTVNPVIDDLLTTYRTSGRLHYLTGVYYTSKGHQNKALSHLSDAVRFAPRLMEAHKEQARILEEQGDPIGAIAAWERAGALAPDAPEPYRALIRLYRTQGELDILCDRWLARYRARPRDETLKAFLIEALHKADRFEEAGRLINN